MTNFSGPKEYVRMLRAREADGLFRRDPQPQSNQPQRLQERAPTTLAEAIHPQGQKDRGATSPLDGRVKQGW